MALTPQDCLAALAKAGTHPLIALVEIPPGEEGSEEKPTVELSIRGYSKTNGGVVVIKKGEVLVASAVSEQGEPIILID